MGCAQAKGGAAPAAEKNKRELFTTNSMLMPRHVFEITKKELGEDAADEESLKLRKVLSDGNVTYKLGEPLEYLPIMTKSEDLLVKVDDASHVDLKFGYVTIAGRVTGVMEDKQNQDSLCVFRVDGRPNQVVFGVFDGHGPYGEYAAYFIRENLHRAILDVYEESEAEPGPAEVLRQGLNRVHEALAASNPEQCNGIGPDLSGAVCVVAMFVGQRLYVANVGDSRCIFGSLGLGQKKPWITALSEDHNPNSKAERARVTAAGGILMTEFEARGVGSRSGKKYLCRRDSQGAIVYGIMFTRSIGDVDAHENLGVSSDADVTEHELLEGRAEYLVLASDGVWDQMDNRQVMDVVYQKGDPLKAAEEISAIATAKWNESTLQARRDDISAVVVKAML